MEAAEVVGCDENPSPQETDPLIRRSTNTRQQFQAAQREAVRSAFLNRDTWCSCGGVCVMLAAMALLFVPLAIFFIEVRSWLVLVRCWGSPCDLGLRWWLLARNLLTILCPRMPEPDTDMSTEDANRQRSRARGGLFVSTLWLVFGYVLTHRASRCEVTSAVLYNWCRFLSIFGICIGAVLTSFPLLVVCFVLAYHRMIAQGWIKSPNAARDDTIEQLEQVKFVDRAFGEMASAAGVAGGHGSEDQALPRDCCCCMEAFDAVKPIVRTPCGHYYHQECLKQWLKAARTCPLCRSDLDALSEQRTA